MAPHSRKLLYLLSADKQQGQTELILPIQAFISQHHEGLPTSVEKKKLQADAAKACAACAPTTHKEKEKNNIQDRFYVYISDMGLNVLSLYSGPLCILTILTIWECALLAYRVVH